MKTKGLSIPAFAGTALDVSFSKVPDDDPKRMIEINQALNRRKSRKTGSLRQSKDGHGIARCCTGKLILIRTSFSTVGVNEE